MLITDLGLYDTIPALVLLGFASVFGVFIMRQFFLNFSCDVEDAAVLDGADAFRTFLRVLLPLSRPALSTLALISFLGYWNDHLWPLVICQGAGCTLPPGLANFQGQFTAEYGLLMAGATVAAATVLLAFVVAQRWLVESVAQTGLNGVAEL